MPIILPKGVSWIHQIKVRGQIWAENINGNSSALNGISSLDLGLRLGREENRSEDILLRHSYIQNLKGKERLKEKSEESITEVGRKLGKFFRFTESRFYLTTNKTQSVIVCGSRRTIISPGVP